MIRVIKVSSELRRKLKKVMNDEENKRTLVSSKERFRSEDEQVISFNLPSPDRLEGDV